MAKVHSNIVQSDGGGVLESMVEDKSGSSLDVIGRNFIFGLIFFFLFFFLFFFFPRHYFRWPEPPKNKNLVRHSIDVGKRS